MTRPKDRKTLPRLAVLPALLLACFGADAGTRTWYGANNGSWSSAGNWNAAGVPVAGDDVFLGSHSPVLGTVDLNANFNSSYGSNNPLKSVTLNSSAIDGYMIVNQTSAASKLTATTLTVGDTTVKNTWNQAAGAVYVNDIHVGLNSTQNSYNFSGGNLAAFNLNVGVHGGGTFTQSGGSSTLKGIYYPGGYGFPPSYTPAYLMLGIYAGSSGTYNLSGGSLAADDISVGWAGNGQFNQSGGNLVIGKLVVGGWSGNGVFNLSGGTLTGNNVDLVRVGGAGSFNLKTGGAMNAGVQIDSGGVFSHQGGSFNPAQAISVDGTLRLNGHAMTVAGLNGSGIVESSAGNATLTVNYSGAPGQAPAVFSGTLQNGVAGMLGLTKAGADMLVLNGNNSYTGFTTVLAGTLQAGSSGAFSAASQHVVNGGVLDTNGKNLSFAALSGSGGVVALSTGVIQVGSANTSTTYSGALTGSGSLNKVGSGAWTLAGGGSYSGDIDVQAGALSVGAANGIATNSRLKLSGAGTVLNVKYDQSLAALAGGGGALLSFGTGRTLTVGGGNTDSNFQGSVAGNDGTVLKTGSGIFTLGGGAADKLHANNAGRITFAVNAGTLALNKADGTNAVGGALLVGGGSVSLARGNQIADTGVITLNGGALNLNGYSDSVGGLGGSGGSLNLAGGTLTVAQGSNSTFAGAMTGAGSFVKSGAAELTLSGGGGFNGGYSVNAGRLVLQGAVSGSAYQANSGGTLRLDGSQVSMGGGAIVAAAGGAVEYRNATVNNGYLRGAGTHDILAGDSGSHFNGVSTYNSTHLIQSGQAQFNNFSNGGKFTNNAAATLDGASNTSSGVIHVNNLLTTTDFSSNGVINVNAGGTLANSGGDLVLGGGSRTYVNAGGTLSSAAGSAVELNGALLVNNGVMTGQTDVNFGGLLRGSGSFGAVSVGEGGIFSPGNSPGLATVNGFTLGAGGSYRFELNDVAGAAGLGFDFVNNLGALTIGAGNTDATRFHLQLATLNLANGAGLALNFDPATAYDFTLVHSAMGIVGFNANKISIDASAFLNPTGGGKFSVRAQGQDLLLHYTPFGAAALAPVPEPGTWALMGLGLLALGAARRRGAATATTLA